jgi:hypothetical protein
MVCKHPAGYEYQPQTAADFINRPITWLGIHTIGWFDEEIVILVKFSVNLCICLTASVV